MNFVSELAYSVHIAQSNKSAREKRQRNKYSHSVLFEDEDELFNSDESTKLIEQENPTISTEDRRAEGDRRQSKLARGRYIESRQQKNRRNSPDVDIKI